jgi:hypothetical protein
MYQQKDVLISFDKSPKMAHSLYYVIVIVIINIIK